MQTMNNRMSYGKLNFLKCWGANFTRMHSVSNRSENKSRNFSVCAAPARYYSSLVVSRNFLRFSFAPLIPFPSFLQWDLRYAWSRPQNAISCDSIFSVSSSLFLSIFLFHLYSREDFTLSPFLCVPLILSFSLCHSLVWESLSPPRTLDSRCVSTEVRRAVFESPRRCSPFRRLHYAMRILEESEGYFLQGVPGVWGRPELETFLACRVMVCLKLNYRKCRAILDDWLNTHRKGKHGARESIDIALY